MLEESAVLFVRCQARSLWQLVLKTPELPGELQQIFFLIILFIYNCAQSSLLRAGFYLLWCAGFLMPCYFFEAWALGCSGFSSCSLEHRGLVILQHLGSSQTKDQTCVSYNGRGILYYWGTREAPQQNILKSQAREGNPGIWEQPTHNSLLVDGVNWKKLFTT